jgi:hypothetical protein
MYELFAWQEPFGTFDASSAIVDALRAGEKPVRSVHTSARECACLGYHGTRDATLSWQTSLVDSVALSRARAAATGALCECDNTILMCECAVLQCEQQEHMALDAEAIVSRARSPLG